MTRLLLTLIAIIAFATQFAAPAHAVVNASPVGKKVCYVHGVMNDKSRTSVASYEPCGLLNDVSAYAGFRIEPMTGLSLTPIKHGSACYYISNQSKNSYFIPSGSDNEFNAFMSHSPAGVSVIPCAQPMEVSVQDRCNGLVTASNTALYNQGFQAIGMGYVGERRAYNIVSSENKVLRTLIATGTKNGWSFAFSNPCPNTQTANANNGADASGVAQAKPVQVVATPAAFTRDGATQRVLINDGTVAAPVATAPVVTAPVAATPAATVTRVMITDGALVRNIKG